MHLPLDRSVFIKEHKRSCSIPMDVHIQGVNGTYNKIGTNKPEKHVQESGINRSVKMTLQNFVERHSVALKAGYVPIRAEVCDNLRAQANPGARNQKKCGPAPADLGANPHSELNIQGALAKLRQSCLPEVPLMPQEEPARGLRHIFLGQVAGNRERYSLLHFREIGETQLANYYREKVLRQGSGGAFVAAQQKLKGWSKPAKKVSKKQTMREEREREQALALKTVIQDAMDGKPIDPAIKHLFAAPPTLFDEEGGMRKGAKSVFFKASGGATLPQDQIILQRRK
jgi:hypothetical protein